MDVILNRHMSQYPNRLQTFFPPPPPNVEFSISNSPMKLAEAGFIRKMNAVSDEVECCFCGAKYSNWSGESPLAVHRTLNPKCSFLNTPPSTNTHNLDNHNNEEVEAFRKQLCPDNISSSPSSIFNVPDIQHPFLPKQGGYLMLFEGQRRLTFIHADIFSPAAVVYAEGGFVYNVATKSVFCVFCNVELDFKQRSRPVLDSVHEDKSPQCPFMCLFDVGNISLDTETQIHEKVFLQRQHKAQTDRVKYAIKHPQFEDEDVRVGTYSTWPKCLARTFPSRMMAECGFYYTGFSDKVKCYACGIGLADWSTDADPATQHAKSSPHCVFLLHAKGKEFIERAQNEQLTVEADEETTIPQLPESVAASPTIISSSSAPLPSLAAKMSPTSLASNSASGSLVLDLEAVEAAMACRYPNTSLLLGTLKAADENYERLCEKSQEVLEKEALYQEKAAQFQIKEAQHEAEKAAYRQEIRAKDRELQRTTFELEWRDLVRTDLEQQFIEQIQELKELLQQQREQLEQKDQVIEYNAVQSEDLQRHIKSLRAELDRRQMSPASDDEESASSSSDQEHTSCEPDSHLDEIPVANCKVCLVKPSQILFLPCKHLCCCDHCASRLHGKNCPICRERNLGFEKVYVI
ncbi:unnamed protein product [Candidula unifasciata]|uniref:RING-type domain-containing protein n=1 Tax=Candidula unifasciata TaxID=100452 RepID=A0A8S3ZZ32_9EUPU|nr:unnamed protein product [Candidula unifasciata]